MCARLPFDYSNAMHSIVDPASLTTAADIDLSGRESGGWNGVAYCFFYGGYDSNFDVDRCCQNGSCQLCEPYEDTKRHYD